MELLQTNGGGRAVIVLTAPAPSEILLSHNGHSGVPGFHFHPESLDLIADGGGRGLVVGQPLSWDASVRPSRQELSASFSGVRKLSPKQTEFHVGDQGRITKALGLAEVA